MGRSSGATATTTESICGILHIVIHIVHCLVRRCLTAMEPPFGHQVPLEGQWAIIQYEYSVETMEGTIHHTQSITFHGYDTGENQRLGHWIRIGSIIIIVVRIRHFRRKRRLFCDYYGFSVSGQLSGITDPPTGWASHENSTTPHLTLRRPVPCRSSSRIIPYI